nr:VOC family protein [Croceibacterium sp. D39]
MRAIGRAKEEREQGRRPEDELRPDPPRRLQPRAVPGRRGPAHARLPLRRHGGLYVHGVKHLAFQVDDAEAAAKEPAANGAKIVLGPVVGLRPTYVFVADNSGIPFELIEFR